ncbi:integrase core domain protein [Plakobranchus ocellatus]|uniref:Integrase core domain protein n=1 Tax=Plakobranchus ocellatus TaxID=259542 RepID=A0AAV4ASU9_9GAST|nr:integrase core domain protein [Plakobranchus ocellatus]
MPGQESRHIEVQGRFYDKLSQVRAKAAKTFVFLTKVSYQKLVNDVKKAKTTTKKEPRDYWLLKHDVLSVENKSLKTKSVEEEAYKLVDIFSLLGAPTALQSDNCRKLANNVVRSLKE